MPRRGLPALLSVCAALAQPPAAPKLRLPAAARPLAYELHLRLVPGQDDFSGRVRIDLEVRRATPVLWLHAKELTFTDARAGEVSAQVEPAGDDFVAITPERPLGPGRTTLTIDYTGKISRTLTDGIFHQQENRDWYLFTKFEPVTARRAFPCFDEPSFKTPWQVTLRVPGNVKAFSNTPAVSETAEPDGTKTVRFARTRPLPSYLVALAVGPFDVVDVPPIGRQRVPGRILAPRGRGAEAAYAASVTPRAVELLEDYFGIPYPYAKLDQVVVPVTTAWGAIENAGLIAYGQFLLAQPNEDTLARQRSRLGTMVHEIAHQWVGDLVTAAWWDDLWLSEGFAVWITAKILDRWRPEWKMRSSAAGSVNSAMNADALVSARTVRQPIEAPGDIANAFDDITYLKGAALLGMFENWLGEETFRQGVRRYLVRHAWGNATTSDLLAALGQAAGRDVSAAGSSFLDQRGVPLLKADVRCDRSRPVLRLAQERFLPMGSAGSRAAVWKLPVCFRWSDGASERRACVLLTEARAEFPLRGAHACPAWLLANDNAAGYYRSAYEGDWFDRLLEAGIGRLPPHEQAGLLQNVQALVGGGQFDARQALSLARRFSDSGERDIVTAALRIAGSISPAVPEELAPNYARFLRAWLGQRARLLGWQPQPDESEDTKMIRLAIVPLVAIGGEDPELGAQAGRLAQAWLQDRKAIDRDTAGYILITAARRGDRAFFEQLVSALRKTKDQMERLHMISGLGSFRDPDIMRSVLDLVLGGGEGLDPRELRGVISSQWRETRATVWDFVKRNFDALNARLPGARGIPYGATLPSAASGFCHEARAAEVESFFLPRIAGLSGAARNLARVLENIRLCSARRTALETSVRQFLSQP
jgi:alanyl aminopeptidase